MTLTAPVKNSSGIATGDYVEIGSAPASGAAINIATQTALDAKASTASVTTGLSRKGYNGNGIAVLGDSITSVNASTNTDTPGHAWHSVLTAISGGRLIWRGGQATSGYTVQQIRDNHLPTILAMSPLPAACIVFGGTNNVGAVDYNLTTDIAALVQIYDALEAVGVRPIAALIPPRGTATNNVPQWNHRVLSIARARGYDVLDFFGLLVNPADGTIQTSLQTDSTHPNNLGQTLMGQHAWSVLGPRFPSRVVQLCGYQSDAGNLLGTDGFFIADSNSDGRANGWSGSGTPTIVTADGLNWQRLSFSTGDTPGTALLQKINIASGFVAGNLLELSMRMRIVGRLATESLASTMDCEVRDAASGGNVIGRFGTRVKLPDGDYILSARGVLPTGALGLRVNIQADTSSEQDYYLEVAQVCLRNLTTLGITA